ncbi:Lrp/AsnC family transcriptional regulator [Pyrococcus sp. NA2]|uniref:Lrp/AsnC family transcriptional regulator n=1 Tax=Pyrococcus sp. (strain NA2) TaxID=342949 RepID=UPI00068D66D5|nr:Lrp/AsnC family transcriptional regulator [Pyrococcus sp. NA2]
MRKLDETDRRILLALTRNARIKLVELSKMLGISVTAIQKRIAKLEEEGIIDGYSARLNFEKMGYSISAFIRMAVEPSMREHVLKELSKLDTIVEFYEVSGDYDIIARVVARDIADLRDTLLTSLTKIGGIRKTSTMVIMREHICDLGKLLGVNDDGQANKSSALSQD